MRLRLIGTDHYLTMATHKEGTGSARFPLILTGNKNHSNTLFQLRPVYQRDYESSPLFVPFWLCVQPKAKSTFWVHVADDFWTLRAKGITSDVFCTRDPASERDAFRFSFVPNYQIEDFTTAQTSFNKISSFKTRLDAGKTIYKPDFAECEQTLEALIFYVTISPEQNPLTRHGVISKTRQRMIGTESRIRLLVGLLHSQKLVDGETGERILQLVWVLLSHIVRGSPKHGLLLHEYLNFTNLSASETEDTKMLKNFHQIRILRESFFKYDTSGDGRLEEEEIVHVFTDLGFTREQGKKYFLQLDKDHSGELTFDEFLAGFTSEFAESKGLSLRTLSAKEMDLARKTFYRYDRDGSGSIDHDELLFLLHDLAIPENSPNGVAMLKLLEENEEHELNFRQFLDAIRYWSHVDNMGDFSGPVYTFFASPQTLVEMYKNNVKLLFDLTQLHINIIVELVASTKNPGYLKLLSTLCMCGGRAIPINQKMIAAAIQRAEDAIFVKRKVYQGHEVQVFDEEANSWVTLLEFADRGERRGAAQYEYFIEFLTLLGNLCIDRNVQGIQLVSLKVSFKEAFIGLKSELLFPAIRTAYCRIILHVFAVASLSTGWVDLKRLWAQGDIEMLGDQIEQEPVWDEAQTREKLHSDNPDNTQKFLLNYFSDERNFRFDKRQCDTGQPRFLVSIVDLMKYSIHFGVLKRLPEKYIIPRLREILQTRYENGQIIDFNGSRRDLGPEWLPTLISIWISCVEMLEMYYNIETNRTLNHFIWETSKANRLENADAWRLAMNKRLLESFEKEESHGLPNLSPANVEFGMSNALFELLKVGNNQLSASALTLLNRVLTNTCEEVMLLPIVNKLELAVTDDENRRTMELKATVKTLEQLSCTPNLSEAQEKEMARILTHLIEGCLDQSQALKPKKGDIQYDPRPQFAAAAPRRAFQTSLRNLYIHDIIFMILRLPLVEDAHGVLDQTSPMTKIHKLCYDFLRAFCVGNPKNQRLLSKFIDFLLEPMTRYPSQLPEIPFALIEVFKDNLELCQNIPEHLIVSIIDMISADSRGLGTYMAFLRCVIAPGGEYLRNSQNLVLRLLMRNRGTLLFLSKKDELEHLTPASISPFNNSIVTLLALCAGGRNHFTELTCQQLLAFDACMNVVCNDAAAQEWVFYAYSFFLDEVFLNTEVTSVATMTQTAEDAGRFLIPLRAMHTFLKGYHVSALSAQPYSSTNFFSDEWRLDVVLSFIHNYFSKYGRLDAGTEELVLAKLLQVDLGKIAHSLLKGYKMLNLSQKDTVYNAHRLMAVNRALTSTTPQGAPPEKKLVELQSEITDIFESRQRKQHSLILAEQTRLADTRRVTDIAHKKVDLALADFLPVNDTQPTFLELLVGALKSLDSSDDKLKIPCIKILKAHLMRPPDEFGDPRQKSQEEHIKYDVPLSVLPLISGSNEELKTLALEYLVAVLDDGTDRDTPRTNQRVKELFLRQFTSSGPGHFFQDVADILHSAKNMMKITKGKQAVGLLSMALSTRSFSSNLPLVPQATNRPKNKKRIKESKRGRSGSTSQKKSRAKEEQSTMSLTQQTALLQTEQLLGMINLLCQGQNDQDSVMRELLQAQPGDFQSRDILKEMNQYVRHFNWDVMLDKSDEEGLSREIQFYMKLAIQTFKALREAVKGVHKNKMVSLTSGVCLSVNSILAKPSHRPDHDVLKLQVLELMLTILDGADFRVIGKMVKLLDFDTLLACTSPLDPEKHPEEPSEFEVKIGSSAYRLMKELSDHDPTSNGSLARAVQSSEVYCRKRIGRLEILVNTSNGPVLQLAYFPIPEQCQSKDTDGALSTSLDGYLLDQGVNWQKHHDRMKGYLEWCEDFIARLELDGNNKRRLVRAGDMLKWVTWLLILAVQLCLLFNPPLVLAP